MKAITILTLSLLVSAASMGQLSSNLALDENLVAEEVELLIVRNAEECLGHESSIYEIVNDKREKVAFLYHESDMRTAASNFYNLNAIRQVLDDYAKLGYNIRSSAGENLDGRCNRQLRYSLIKEHQD